MLERLVAEPVAGAAVPGEQDLFSRWLTETGAGSSSGRGLSVGVEPSGRRDAPDIPPARSYDSCVFAPTELSVPVGWQAERRSCASWKLPARVS